MTLKSFMRSYTPMDEQEIIDELVNEYLILVGNDGIARIDRTTYREQFEENFRRVFSDDQIQDY